MKFRPSESAGSFIKPGRHVLTIDDKVNRGSANTGTPFLEVTFRGPSASIKDTFYLSERAMFRLANLFELVGADMDADYDTDSDGDMRKAIGGKRIGVIVDEEQYTKKDGSPGTAAKVTGYFAADGDIAPGAQVRDVPGDEIPF